MTPALAWKASALPGCMGHPCFVARVGEHVARIWQSSPITTGEEWRYRVDGGSVQSVRGNRGAVKTAALWALRRLT